MACLPFWREEVVEKGTWTSFSVIAGVGCSGLVVMIEGGDISAAKVLALEIESHIVDFVYFFSALHHS